MRKRFRFSDKPMEQRFYNEVGETEFTNVLQLFGEEICHMLLDECINPVYLPYGIALAIQEIKNDKPRAVNWEATKKARKEYDDPNLQVRFTNYRRMVRPIGRGFRGQNLSDKIQSTAIVFRKKIYSEVMNRFINDKIFTFTKEYKYK